MAASLFFPNIASNSKQPVLTGVVESGLEELVFTSILKSRITLICFDHGTIIRTANWWSSNKKYFCFLLIASRALLQSHAEFNRLL